MEQHKAYLIEVEVDGLTSLSELLRDQEPTCERRETFFKGIAELIEGAADRIKKVLLAEDDRHSQEVRLSYCGIDRKK